MNYNNYPAIGIDAKIQIIQNQLNSQLPWGGVDFYGRVQKTVSKDLKGIIPEVYISKTERKNVFFDDRNAPGGNVFFVDNDEHTTTDGVVYQANVKIVFMLNLSNISLSNTFRPDSELQETALKLINRIKAMKITSIEKGLDNVLSEFQTEGIKFGDMNPYHIFSVNGNLNYLFNCKNL